MESSQHHASRTLISMITLPDNSAPVVSSLNPKRRLISPVFTSSTLCLEGHSGRSNPLFGCFFLFSAEFLSTDTGLPQTPGPVVWMISAVRGQTRQHRGELTAELNLQPPVFAASMSHHSKLRPVNNTFPAPHGSSSLHDAVSRTPIPSVVFLQSVSGQGDQWLVLSCHLGRIRIPK